MTSTVGTEAVFLPRSTPEPVGGDKTVVRMNYQIYVPIWSVNTQVFLRQPTQLVSRAVEVGLNWNEIIMKKRKESSP